MANSNDRITYFGVTDSRNKEIKFGIKTNDRTRHFYVIGKTGMGKSTVLENMAVQDIQNGEGLCFIDPHGKTAELLLEYIPESRVKDLIYFAPFDVENPIAFNVMEDVGYDKRHLVVSGLMSTFKKIWIDAWSARMEYILGNTLLALLEYPGATLLGVNKMYADKAYRKKVVDNIKDSSVKSFWVDEFAKYTDKFAAEATPAIQNKIGQFTNNPLIRNIIGQPKSSFDFRKLMDDKKIVIVNLSKGRVGESNANLLGAMIITKIYLAAMSRADATDRELAALPQFYLYVDEFQSFANESFADILSEARKYKLNLTIAHQYIEQMSEEVRAAVFGNVGTMVVFRVGSYDAEVLEKEFSPQFTAEDIVNLGQFQFYLRLMIDSVGSQPFSARGLPPIAPPTISFKQQAIESSRKQFGQPRALVEDMVRLQIMNDVPTTVAAPTSFSNAPRVQNDKPQDFKKDFRPQSSFQRDERRERSAFPPRQNLQRKFSDGEKPRPVEAPKPALEPTEGFTSLKDMVAKIPSNAPQTPRPERNPEQRNQPIQKKAGTQEHKDSLRAALMGFVKPEEKKTEEKPKPESKPVPVAPKKSESQSPAQKQNDQEVPEHVLRNILDVE